MPIALSADRQCMTTVNASPVQIIADLTHRGARGRVVLLVFAGLSLVIASLSLAGCTLYARVREFAPGGDLLAPSAPPVSREDVVRLTAVGIADDIILERLAAEGLSRPLASGDISLLQRAGVSARVIEAMREARLVPSSQLLAPSRSDRRYLYWRPGLSPNGSEDPFIDTWDPLWHRDRW